jgi:hypothetical protein
MVREEILCRQLLAAEDQLLAALKQGGLEEFMHQWASLQASIAVGAEQGKLSVCRMESGRLHQQVVPWS